MATIGANLKRLREGEKLTQEELADRAGVKQAAISKWETDKATPDVTSLLRLAVGLGLRLDELVAEVSDEYESIRSAPTDGSVADARIGHANIDPVTRQFSDLWSLLTEKQRTALVNYVRAMLGIAPDAAAETKKGAGRGPSVRRDR